MGESHCLVALWSLHARFSSALFHTLKCQSICNGHSAHTESACAVQVEEKFLSVVQPFLKQHAHLKLPPDAPSTYSLYLWATAVASAYSFTIGDDR